VRVFSRSHIDGCLAGQNITLEPDVTLVEEGRTATGVPVPEASCDDGVKNGDETGIDCGGSCIALCPFCSGGGTYEAETMFHSTGGSAPSGWNIWSNGYISTNHTFNGAGPASVTVTARGQVALGIWPRMVVSVGGAVVGQVNVSSSTWAPYTFTFDAAAGSRELRVAFTNDFNSPTADRNLLVDKVSVTCD
jgi:hypothetical protein